MVTLGYGWLGSGSVWLSWEGVGLLRKTESNLGILVLWYLSKDPRTQNIYYETSCWSIPPQSLNILVLWNLALLGWHDLIHKNITGSLP